MGMGEHELETGRSAGPHRQGKMVARSVDMPISEHMPALLQGEWVFFPFLLILLWYLTSHLNLCDRVSSAKCLQLPL